MKELVYRIVKGGYHDDYVTADILYVVTSTRTIVAKLDPSDGYRSYMTVLPDGEYDMIAMFVAMKAPQEENKRIIIPYTYARYDFKDTKRKTYHDGYDDIVVRAWRKGKVVFEAGTDNADDYYPSYFVWSEKSGKERGYR